MFFILLFFATAFSVSEIYSLLQSCIFQELNRENNFITSIMIKSSLHKYYISYNMVYSKPFCFDKEGLKLTRYTLVY